MSSRTYSSEVPVFLVRMFVRCVNYLICLSSLVSILQVNKIDAEQERRSVEAEARYRLVSRVRMLGDLHKFIAYNMMLF